MRIILASGSPRRKKLLNVMDLDFEICVSNVEEIVDEKLPISEKVKELSYIKAKCVFDNTSGDRIVVGADTMVYKNGVVYGKPEDRNDAIKVLKNLKNDINYIYTGLTVLVSKNNKYKEYVIYDVCEVLLKDMSEKEIETWIDTGKAYDKAGSYTIQDEFSVFVDKINGNYNTAIGLPIHKLYDILKYIGIYN